MEDWEVGAQAMEVRLQQELFRQQEQEASPIPLMNMSCLFWIVCAVEVTKCWREKFGQILPWAE